MNIRRFTAALFLGAATLLINPLPSAAQSDKPAIKMVLGLAPGGVNDIVARGLAEKLRGILGQTVLVENKPGAGQRLALGEVKRAKPDGSVLLIATNSPLTVLPHMYPQLDYDPVKDFTPIARVLTFELAVASGPMVPLRDIRELVSWVKANPQKAMYGSPGSGTSPHFVGVMLGTAIGTDLEHIGYKGGAPAFSDLIGGQIPLVVNSLSDMVQLHKMGKIRILASTGEQRSNLVPDVPTMKESGINMTAAVSIGVYGPAGMPADVVKRLNAAIVEAVNSPDLRQRFVSYGLTPAPSTPAELAVAQADDFKRWAGPVKKSGFKPE
jgi:tripartite-type tricarboxylate transporter receptor subunit TctC